MALKTVLCAAVAALIALPAYASDIMIKDPYARSSAMSGAAFFTIMNHTDSDDRLIAARTDAAPRVELHTHTEDANGVMRMREIEGGIAVPAGGMHALKRGGDHVMFMGLDGGLPEGEEITVTLVFETAGDVTIQIPVDNDRTAKGGHGEMSHSHDGDHKHEHKHGD